MNSLENIQILEKAKHLLMTVGWTKGASARTVEGYKITPNIKAKDIVSYCSWGAILTAANYTCSLAISVEDLFISQLLKCNYSSLPEWNDSDGITKEDVLDMFDTVIKTERNKLDG